jgi:hypothetical protein
MLFTWRTIPNAFAALSRAGKTLFSRNPTVAILEVQDERERRCAACQYFTGVQCGLCTCVVSMKVLLASESCPDDPPRWRKQTRFSTGL